MRKHYTYGYYNDDGALVVASGTSSLHQTKKLCKQLPNTKRRWVFKLIPVVQYDANLTKVIPDGTSN